ncbi:BEM_collapsed_G0038110.mRNA.1.CDS.1 [Saccharomyces cerevisiae]|nr:BEM_collapsed_G0038110.mRNA.1.CDS.1 [Saccharomyces cerevisiae]
MHLNLWDIYDYWQDQPDNYLKRRSNLNGKKETEISFFPTYSPLAKYLLSLETTEFRKIAFSGLSAAGNALCSKSFYTLDQRLRHHTIALFEFPLIRFHQTDTPVFHGIVRLISLI